MPRPRRSNLSQQSRNARRIRNIANEKTVEEQEIAREERRVSMARLRASQSQEQNFTALDIKTTSYGKKVSKNSPSSSQESINGSEPPTTRKRPNKKIAHGDEEEISFASSSNVAPTSNNVPCPICGVDFPEKKIEEHASTCGDEPILTRCRIQKLTPISCNICDAVIPLNTTYEVHVKDCIQRQMEQDMRDVK